jgi:hypothetical protein
MTNRITHIEIRNRSLTPAEAEVWITVHAEQITSTTEVRGRLMGPTCLYSTTVEVAYPLRPLPHPPADVPPLTLRVVIPEPSLWEPVSPFLYHGPIELWQAGQRCDSVTVRHGLCAALLTPYGLRWNGKPLVLRGRSVRGLSDDNAMSLRQAGVNLLLAPIHVTQTWDIADRLGFLVVGELSQLNDDALRRIEQLASHPSCLGWRVEGVEPNVLAAILSLSHLRAAFVVSGDTQVSLLIRSEGPSVSPPVIGSIV